MFVFVLFLISSASMTCDYLLFKVYTEKLAGTTSTSLVRDSLHSLNVILCDALVLNKRHTSNRAPHQNLGEINKRRGA